MGLSRLPYDLLLNIACFLDLRDIHALHLTCKSLHDFTTTRPVYRKLATDLLRKCRALPLKGFQRLPDLSTAQLIRAVNQAARFDSAWRHRAPRPIGPLTARHGSSHYMDGPAAAAALAAHPYRTWYKVVSAPPAEEVDWLSPITSSYTLCATKSGKVVCWDVQSDSCLAEWNPGQRWELWKCRVEFDERTVYFTMAKILHPSQDDGRVMEFVLMRLTFSDPPSGESSAQAPVFSSVTEFRTTGVVMNIFLLDPSERLLSAFVWVARTNTIGLYALLDWNEPEYAFIDTGIDYAASANWSCILFDQHIVIHCEEPEWAHQYFYPFSLLRAHVAELPHRLSHPQLIGRVPPARTITKKFVFPALPPPEPLQHSNNPTNPVVPVHHHPHHHPTPTFWDEDLLWLNAVSPSLSPHMVLLLPSTSPTQNNGPLPAAAPTASSSSSSASITAATAGGMTTPGGAGSSSSSPFDDSGVVLAEPDPGSSPPPQSTQSSSESTSSSLIQAPPGAPLLSHSTLPTYANAHMATLNHHPHHHHPLMTNSINNNTISSSNSSSSSSTTNAATPTPPNAFIYTPHQHPPPYHHHHHHQPQAPNAPHPHHHQQPQPQPPQPNPFSFPTWYPESAHFVRQWWPTLPGIPRVSCTVVLLAMHDQETHRNRFVLAQHYFKVPIDWGMWIRGGEMEGDGDEEDDDEDEESHDTRKSTKKNTKENESTKRQEAEEREGDEDLMKMWYVSTPFEVVRVLDEREDEDQQVVERPRPLVAVDFGHAVWIEYCDEEEVKNGEGGGIQTPSPLYSQQNRASSSLPLSGSGNINIQNGVNTPSGLVVSFADSSEGEEDGDGDSVGTGHHLLVPMTTSTSSTDTSMMALPSAPVLAPSTATSHHLPQGQSQGMHEPEQEPKVLKFVTFPGYDDGTGDYYDDDDDDDDDDEFDVNDWIRGYDEEDARSAKGKGKERAVGGEDEDMGEDMDAGSCDAGNGKGKNRVGMNGSSKNMATQSQQQQEPRRKRRKPPTQLHPQHASHPLPQQQKQKQKQQQQRRPKKPKRRRETEGTVRTLAVPQELDLGNVETINIDQSQGAVILSDRDGKIYILCYE